MNCSTVVEYSLASENLARLFFSRENLASKPKRRSNSYYLSCFFEQSIKQIQLNAQMNNDSVPKYFCDLA